MYSFLLNISKVGILLLWKRRGVAAAHGSKTKYNFPYAKGHSAQPDMF
jgi:hypothetical protein